MDGKSFDVLCRLMDAFWDSGWVDGLTAEQYARLNEAKGYVEDVESSDKCRDAQVKIAHQLRAEGYTIRQIAATLGYKHPGSITNLLNKAL